VLHSWRECLNHSTRTLVETISAYSTMTTDGSEESTIFPERIETERLHLERISHDTVDVFALHEFYSNGDETGEMFESWDSNPHDTVKETHVYVSEAEQLWNDGEAAKYVIRPKEGEDGAGAIAGTTGLYPDWEKRSANLGIILDKRFWGVGIQANESMSFSPSRLTDSTSTSLSPPTLTGTRSLDEQSTSTSNGMTANTRGFYGIGIRRPMAWPTFTDTRFHKRSISRHPTANQLLCSGRESGWDSMLQRWSECRKDMESFCLEGCSVTYRIGSLHPVFEALDN